MKFGTEWLHASRLGMASAVDESVSNITAALKGSGLWRTTLVVWSSDNGGPSFVGGPSCANNCALRRFACAIHASVMMSVATDPLRGGKGNDFSGGTRVAAWVNGGLLPDAVRGGTITALIHMADCAFAAATPIGCGAEHCALTRVRHGLRLGEC